MDSMARFDDYRRTVVGYHGTGLTAALRIVNRVDGCRWSRRDFDWLGHGIYFWEYAPEQALAARYSGSASVSRLITPVPRAAQRLDRRSSCLPGRSLAKNFVDNPDTPAIFVVIRLDS
jgi:hypothetical protein